MKRKCRTINCGIEKDISWGDIVIPVTYQNTQKFQEGVSGLFMGGCTPEMIEKARWEDIHIIERSRSRFSFITGYLKAMDEVYTDQDTVTITMVYGHLTRKMGSHDTFGMVIPIDTRVLVRDVNTNEQTFNTLTNFHRVRQMISMVTPDQLDDLNKEYNIDKYINAEVDRVNRNIDLYDPKMIGCGVYFGPLIQEYNGPVKSKQVIKPDISSYI